MNKRWSGGKIAALIFGSLIGIFILVLAFCVDIYRLSFHSYETEAFDWKSELKKETAEQSDPERGLKNKSAKTFDWKSELKQKTAEQSDLEKGLKNKSAETFDWKNELKREPENQEKTEDDKYWEGIEYYQFTDYIREDLSYQIELESLETKDGNVCMSMSYPVVSGEQVPNLDGINKALQNEITAVEKYLEKVESQLTEDENYEFQVEGYVTYMSEEVLSVAYVEYGYWNSEIYESYIISVNIDMTTGMIIDNTQILEIDDAFSIEFRERSEEQNGSGLPEFSDQEITEYLNDRDFAIILYTPLGMEVGMNYYNGWITVTYPDYRDYLKQL